MTLMRTISEDQALAIISWEAACPVCRTSVEVSAYKDAANTYVLSCENEDCANTGYESITISAMAHRGDPNRFKVEARTVLNATGWAANPVDTEESRLIRAAGARD